MKLIHRESQWLSKPIGWIWKFVGTTMLYIRKTGSLVNVYWIKKRLICDVTLLFMSYDVLEDKTRTTKSTFFGCRLQFSFPSVITIISMVSHLPNRSLEVTGKMAPTSSIFSFSLLCLPPMSSHFLPLSSLNAAEHSMFYGSLLTFILAMPPPHRSHTHLPPTHIPQSKLSKHQRTMAKQMIHFQAIFQRLLFQFSLLFHLLCPCDKHIYQYISNVINRAISKAQSHFWNAEN